ncbi:MAG: FtsX-like permease family protein [Promethearchaeota archaeon]
MLNFKLIFKYAFKDLGRQKIRSAIGIVGVFFSIALLAIVLFLSDSIAVTFAEYLSIDAGNQDMLITVRHYNGEPINRSNYFEFNPLINKIDGNFPQIDGFIPRMELYGKVNVSQGFKTQELTNERVTAFISGINFSLERSLGFGAFVEPKSNKLLELNELSDNECAILYKFSEDIKYVENDTIEIEMSLQYGNMTHSNSHNFTITQIFDFQQKWPIRYANRPLVVMDINTLYDIFGQETFGGKCNNLILTIKNTGNYYDVRDLEGTENKVKDLAGEIQMELGINEYFIDLPKLEVLGYSEWLSVGITIIFVFISMIAMLISGVLINGILKTSVEERIREFGIFRTLGASKNHNLMIVLVQGFLLCNFGTIIGIIGAQLLTEFMILPFAEVILSGSIPGLAGNITYSITLASIMLSYIIGIGVGLIVSISPAIKAMKLQLIESIHPYRHEDTLYHLQKRASVNYKLIIVGLILTANGLFIIIVLPRIMISGDLALMAGVLIALLILFLIGTTLAGLGIMPIILHFFIQAFRLISRKLSPIYKIFVFRYARRNSSTILIFAFTFSFVIFVSGVFTFLSDQGEIETTLDLGSDLVIETIGWDDPEEIESERGFGLSGEPINLLTGDLSVNPYRILTSEFKESLLQIEGIEKVSTIIASPYHLTQIYSDEENDFSAEIGDYAGLSTIEISLIAVDKEYASTIDTNYIEFTGGNIVSSFNNLFSFESPYTCIISEAISVNLNLNLGDLIRIVVYRGDESEIYPFRIVGIATAMPGFSSQFSRSSGSASGGGVLIAHQTYMTLMDIPPIPYLDKIFIKLTKIGLSNYQTIETIIWDNYRSTYDFDLKNLQNSINQEQLYFSILDIFFTITLDATIIICLFGLISSSYSSIIERKKDIGVIRTLGLKGRHINRLFTIEALIIMYSSGSVGVLIGYTTGLLLSSSLNQLSDLPTPTNFPFSEAISVFSIATIFVLIGMLFLLRKVRKKKIIEIYRETM